MPKRKAESESKNEPMKQKNSFWALGLLTSMNDPNLQVYSDDEIVVIKDKYPKAKFHYLVMPKDDISDLKKLTKDHVDLLKHMEDAGHKVIKDEVKKGTVFKFGYHARASMQRLHLHVISNDMISDSLKTKKHWLTFTTEFFLKAEDVREDLSKNGKVTVPADTQIKKYFETSLKCHKCEQEQKNIPTLKKHLEKCTK